MERKRDTQEKGEREKQTEAKGEKKGGEERGREPVDKGQGARG